MLLTGATGFLGMELLGRYLERPDRTVLTPVKARDPRPRGPGSTPHRVLFGASGHCRGRVIAIPGDLERDGLGLAPEDREVVRERATEIVHCAATVSFLAGIDEARRINVDGTHRVVELAEWCARRGALRHLAHVSSAYVPGTHNGVFAERDLEVTQRFRNPYERSGFEAEQLIRARAGELPTVTILRPSIIVGESTTGWTPTFNVLYVALRAFARRQLRVLPGRPAGTGRRRPG